MLVAGMLYFFALGCLELSGVFLRAIPRRAERILEHLRKSKTTHLYD